MTDEAQQTILLIGASGRIGRLALAEALRRGLAVLALVRDPASLADFSSDGRLTTVEGTPLEIEDMRRAVKAASGPIATIVSTLGQTRKSGSPWAAPTSPPKFISEAMHIAVQVAKENDVEKIVAMSLLGAGDSLSANNFIMRHIFQNSHMLQTLEDANGLEEVVKKSGLNFVLVRSSMMMGKGLGTVKDLGNRGEKAGFMPSITPETVANFLITSATTSTFDNRTPVIAS
jgi:putative NADH-flavin reductase